METPVLMLAHGASLVIPYALGLIFAICVMGYLVYTLVKPENF